MSEKNYSSYDFRKDREQSLLTERECKLMDILMTFGKSIDSGGYDDGDYKTAIRVLLKEKF